MTELARPLEVSFDPSCHSIFSGRVPSETRKLASADHFLSSAMNAKTISLKGSLRELEETALKQ
jgi:hypothetical protein